jgi:mRNA-degrading endonuclease HigB of HigAB toxin-antitoxin module
MFSLDKPEELLIRLISSICNNEFDSPPTIERLLPLSDLDVVLDKDQQIELLVDIKREKYRAKKKIIYRN